MAIDSILNISRQALLNSTSAINTTATNLANVDTEGYVRRRVNPTGTSIYSSLSGLSSIYQAEDVQRIEQRFINSQLITQNQYMGEYETASSLLSQIETVFNEPEDSALSNMMQEFWNSWSDLANNPESSSMRTIVASQGNALANTFNRLNQDLDTFQEDLRQEIIYRTDEINQLLTSINTINTNISNSGSTVSPDLLDQRDLAVNELSSLIGVNTSISENGEVTISSGGAILIAHNYKNSLSADVKYENGMYSVSIAYENGTGTVKSGKLGALLDAHNDYVPDYMEKLDTLAVQLVSAVNAVHSSGYNLNDITGINFFNDSVTGAGDIRVNDAIMSDTTLIATSDTAGVPGNGEVATAIYDLQHESIINGTTASDFYNSLISNIGSKANEYNYLSESQTLVIQNLENQRDSISGVSTDEEMTNLIEYEQAYQASARIIQTIQDMIDITLNLV